MELHTEASRSFTGRRNTLYAIGLVVVGVLDAALAFLVAIVSAQRATTQDTAELVGYIVGYAGCSLLFSLAMIAGAAAVIGWMLKKPFGSMLLRTAFWSGLTVVPLFLLVLALSVALRQR